MKIFFYVTGLWLGLILGTAIANNNLKNYYPMTAIVTEVNTENDYFTITDFNGNEWTYDNVEDWQVNDIASCIMNSKRTEDIKDDEIVKIKYDGFLK